VKTARRRRWRAGGDGPRRRRRSVLLQRRRPDLGPSGPDLGPKGRGRCARPGALPGVPGARLRPGVPRPGVSRRLGWPGTAPAARGFSWSWRVSAAGVAWPLFPTARGSLPRLDSFVFPGVGGAGDLAPGAAVYLPCFRHDHLGHFLACGGTPAAVVVDMLLLLDKPSAVVRLLLVSSLPGCGPAQVKTLLGVADVDHSDTCGCHVLLGGVFLGRAAPPLHARGNPRSDLSDRLAAALRWRFLLEGAVLAARAVWLLEMVASPM
jgi:hypothetical protein